MFNLGGEGRGVGGHLAITPTGPTPPTPTGHIFSPLSGSPGAVTQDAGSLDSSGSGSIPLSWGLRSPGKVSPLRGRTMKEYEEQLAGLKKENFALKLRIYFLEERVGQKGEKEDKEQLYRTNIELKVETEALKQEVYDKQELVREASAALAALDQQYQNQLEAAACLHHQETAQLHATVTSLQKEVEEYAERVHCAEGERAQLGELTQLCGLAFPSDDVEKEDGCPTEDGHLGLGIWGRQVGEKERKGESNNGESERRGLDAWNEKVTVRENSMWGDEATRGPATPHPCPAMHNPCPTTPHPCPATPHPCPDVNPALSIYSGDLASPLPIQGIFSLPEPTNQTRPSTSPPANSMPPCTPGRQQKGVEVVGRLKDRITELEQRVEELEAQLEVKEEMKCVLQGDLENLKKEVEEKVERMVELEGEVAEREERLEEVMQELETRHSQLKDKDHQISSLHNDLNRVQPEMEVKVQEIVERDRIIEEKIEQIEQQNKILVEIQITLDERQKQLADAETRLAEAEAKLAKAEARADEAGEKVTKLTQDLEKGCKVIQTFAEEVHGRDKEIAGLRKEVKRKEKKIRDLVNELKEALDMLNKAKWEAETSGGEDGVKEMAEEENERLWAEVEARKNELMSVRTAAEATMAAAEERARGLTGEVATLTAQRDQQAKESATQLAQLSALQAQLDQVRAETSGREGQLAAAQAQVEGLEAQLTDARTQLDQKRQRLADLEDDLRATTAGELDRQALQVDRLQGHLAALAANSNNPSDQHTGDSGEGKEGQQTHPDTSGTATARVDIVAMTQPVQVSVAGDNAGAIHHLYQEVDRVRCEAGALREERSCLKQQLASLYHTIYHTTPTSAPHNTTPSPQFAIPDAILSTPAPHLTTPTFHITTPAPHITTPLPHITTPAPHITTPAPHITTPLHITTLAPHVTTPALHITTPASCITTSALHITTPAPHITTPAPNITTPALHITTPTTHVGGSHTTIALDHTCTVTTTEDMSRISPGQPTHTAPHSITKDALCPFPVCLETYVDGVEVGLRQEEGQRQEEERQKEAAVGQACQVQVEALRVELEEAQRVGEELGRVGASQAQRHKSEITWLRRRLAESHTACDLLRTRLEELADFLEAILDLEGRGLITLDALPPNQLAALHHSLDQSRALSRSLSQSLMIGMEAGEETGLSTSLSDVSSWGGHDHHPHPALQPADDTTIGQDTSAHPGQDTLRFGEDTTLGLTMTGLIQDTTLSLTQDTTTGLYQDTTIDPSQDTTMGPGQERRAKMVQALATRLTTRLDQKTRELDAIAESVSDLTQRLSTRTSQVTHQAGVIGELRATVGRLNAQLATRDSGHSSDPLPPPPLHLLRDSECEVEPEPGRGGPGSEPSSLGAIKSAYSTDAAIKAHSGRLAQQQQQLTAPGESGVGAGGDQWVVSPSESEAWSEPDRNVSLARIGLDATILAATPDRARPRQPRTSALTSESEREAPQDDPSTPAPAKTVKRRSDVAELRRVSSRLRAVEQLNDTLRAELHLYHTLTHQLSPHHTSSPTTTTTTPAINSTTPADITNPASATDASITTTATTTDATATPTTTAATTTAPTSTRVEGDVAMVAAPLLAEVRGLRSTLEDAITNNDHLRDQLEAALSAHPHEEARFLHLTAALQTAQEEMREARERSSTSQGLVEEARAKADQAGFEAEQARRETEEARTRIEEMKEEAKEINEKAEAAKIEVDEARGKAEEAKAVAEQTRMELDEARLEAAKMKIQIDEARLEVNRVVNEASEARSEAAEVRSELNQTREAAEAKQGELEAEVRQMATLITSLEEEVQRLAAEAAKREQQAEEEGRKLEEKEQRLLEVNEERLALVGECTHLHARLTTQVEDRQRVEVEMEQLVEDKKRLRVEKEELEEDKKRLMEENGLMEVERERGKSVEAELEGLRAELEAERRVTEALQERLEDLRVVHSPDSIATSPSDHSVVVLATSDASQESVTSLEYFPHPAPPHSDLWGHRESLSPTPTPTLASPTPLPPPPHHQDKVELKASVGKSRTSNVNKHEKETGFSRREKDTSITRRGRERSSSNKHEKDTITSRRDRDSNVSKRSLTSSSHWSENKENLLISATTTTTTTTTFGNKRGRKTVDGGNGSDMILAPSAPNRNQEDDDVDFDIYGGLDAYGDGGNTSGESPDLGIGSDHHYSSLERGTTTSSALTANYQHAYQGSGRSLFPHQPPSLPTQLCSEPSHSALSMENERLRGERDNLASRLSTTMVTLKETHDKLSRANQRKETVERAICKQLHETHHVLKRANAHIKQSGSLPQ